MIPLSWYLFVAAILFCVGLYGVISRRNAVAILMSVELMLNAVNINLVAFWRYLAPEESTGLAWAVFCFNRGCCRGSCWPGSHHLDLSST